jgi:hypothetical protein
MSTLGFWLISAGLLPISYWLLKLLFGYVWGIYSSEHTITLKVQKDDGSWVQDSLDVSNDQEFYKLARNLAKKSRTVNDGN